MASNTIFRIFILSLVTFCTCRGHNEAASVIYNQDNVPENIRFWPAEVFTFRGGICTGVQRLERLSYLDKINAAPGDLVSVVTCKSEENLGFTTLEAGKASSLYNLITKDSRAIVSEIRTESTLVKSQNSPIFQTLPQLSSKIKINLKNAPPSFKEIKATIPGCANMWAICKDSLCVDIAEVPSVVSTKPPGCETDLLPMLSLDSEWKPEIKISLADMLLEPELTISRGIDRGEKMTLDFDFTDYLSNGLYTINYELVNRSGDEVLISGKETFIAKEHNKSNIHYNVLIYDEGDWKDITVYDALCSDADKHGYIWNDWNNSKKMRDTMSYCIIENEFNNPLRIRVQKLSGRFDSAEIRPSVYGIKPFICANNTIEFTLPSYNMGKISVEFDGDRQHNLFIYAAKGDKEKPAPDDADTIFFGPGEHDAGTINLNEGQTLYIDYGAVVYGNVVTNGNNITIKGRGILSGEKMKHFGDNQYSWGDFLIRCNKNNASVKNLTIKGITMIDSPGWNLCITKTEGVEIDGVNMISWELNGDGIDIVSCTNVEISNCFIRTYDDCITLKCRFIVSPITDVSNVKIHDCLIWPDYARGVVVGPEAGNINSPGRIHNIEIYDCIFLQHGAGTSGDLRAAFAIGQGNDGLGDLWSGGTAPNSITDIKARNLTFDNIDKKGRNISIWQYGGTPKVTMCRIHLEKLTVIDKNANIYPAFSILTKGSKIEDLTISDFTINGKKIIKTGKDFKIDYPENVEYILK